LVKIVCSFKERIVTQGLSYNRVKRKETSRLKPKGESFCERGFCGFIFLWGGGVWFWFFGFWGGGGGGGCWDPLPEQKDPDWP